MSGENESKMPTTEERREKMQKLLADYPVKVGLGLLQPVNDVNMFMTMSLAEIRKLTAEECGEAAVILNQAATYIQLQMNQINADIKWCEEYITYLIAKDMIQLGSGRYVAKDVIPHFQARAVKANDTAMKLQGIITQARLRYRSLEYMPNQLRGTAQSFADLQQTKRSQRT